MQVIPSSEYARMKWNLKSFSGDLFKAFPDLENIFLEFKEEVFEDQLTIEKIVKYIVFAYHIKSPLVIRMSEISSRKERALIEAGFEREREWPIEIKALINNENEVVVKMILQFLKFEKNTRYSSWIISNENYWNMMQALAVTKYTLKDSADALRMNDTMNNALSSIEAEADKIFMGDRDLSENISSLAVMSKRFAISPEQNASKISEERKREKK
jgi:hypothetical protein